MKLLNNYLVRRKKVKRGLYKIGDKVLQIIEAYTLTSVVLIGITKWYIVNNIKLKKAEKRRKRKGKFNV